MTEYSLVQHLDECAHCKALLAAAAGPVHLLVDGLAILEHFKDYILPKDAE